AGINEQRALVSSRTFTTPPAGLVCIEKMRALSDCLVNIHLLGHVDHGYTLTARNVLYYGHNNPYGEMVVELVAFDLVVHPEITQVHGWYKLELGGYQTVGIERIAEFLRLTYSQA
ncbi:MAG: hypothetical protein ACKPKO_25085, partial [Candidatus Fonsibacter sp.]